MMSGLLLLRHRQTPFYRINSPLPRHADIYRTPRREGVDSHDKHERFFNKTALFPYRMKFLAIFNNRIKHKTLCFRYVIKS